MATEVVSVEGSETQTVDEEHVTSLELEGEQDVETTKEPDFCLESIPMIKSICVLGWECTVCSLGTNNNLSGSHLEGTCSPWRFREGQLNARLGGNCSSKNTTV